VEVDARRYARSPPRKHLSRSSLAGVGSAKRVAAVEEVTLCAITAAITRGARGPFSIDTFELDEPRKDEILVRVVAAGLSHTDLLARDQDLTVPLPAVLGREGAGRVERVGRR
jgi:hypothetical protein